VYLHGFENNFCKVFFVDVHQVKEELEHQFFHEESIILN